MITRKKEFLNLFNIIAAPTEVYGDINEFPRWRMPFVFLLISSLTIGWFMIPVIIEPMKKIFTSSFGEDASGGAIKGVMKSILIVQLIIEPVFKLLRWFVFSGSLYILSLFFVENDSHLFKRIFSVVAYAEGIFIFMSLLTLLIVYAKGLDSIEGENDITIFKGLDFFLKDRNSNPTLAAILNNVNPFSIWYVATIAIGLRVVNKIERLKSVGIASMSWLIWIALNIMQSNATKFLTNLIL